MADRFENGSTANDLGGLPADPLVSGFDPTRRGFYNGGDLEGLLERIDYIRGLGTTAIWLTPSFKNKAVQLEDGPSAGYHGYWITDFTQIDPHLGTNAELRALVDAAHARGMKVLLRHHHQPHGRRHRLPGRGTAPLRVEGRRALPHRLRRPVRRPRLRRDRLLPAARSRGQLPLHAGARPRRTEPEVPRLAQRRPALPQPRRHDLRRRELLLRRLLRARRPVHRAPATWSTA